MTDAHQQRDLNRFFSDTRRCRDSERETSFREIVKGVPRDPSDDRIDSRSEL